MKLNSDLRIKQNKMEVICSNCKCLWYFVFNGKTEFMSFQRQFIVFDLLIHLFYTLPVYNGTLSLSSSTAIWTEKIMS